MFTLFWLVRFSHGGNTNRKYPGTLLSSIYNHASFVFMKERKVIPLHELFPYANAEKLAEIDLALTEQVRIGLDIWNRVVDDPVEFKRLLALLAKYRAQGKLDQNQAAAQASKQPAATIQGTTPVETLCK